MRYSITYEQLQALLAFAEDDRQGVDPDAVEALNELNSAVQKNVLKHFRGTLKRNKMLSERMEKMREHREEKFVDGEFTETGLDSAQVAKALLYQLQQLRTYKLSKYKVMAILYEMYASWLYSKKQRLFVEQPSATQWGPRFWHAFNKLDMTQTVPYEEYKALAELNAGVAAFCRNAAGKYYDITESTLTKMFMKSKAFTNAAPPNNGNKWNGIIDDKDIYAWKKAQDNSNKQ